MHIHVYTPRFLCIFLNTPPSSPPTPTQKKKLKDSPLPVSPPPLCSPISDGPGPLSLGPLVRKSQPKAKAKAREVSGVMDYWEVVGGPDAGERNQPIEGGQEWDVVVIK